MVLLTSYGRICPLEPLKVQKVFEGFRFNVGRLRYRKQVQWRDILLELTWLLHPEAQEERGGRPVCLC